MTKCQAEITQWVNMINIFNLCIGNFKLHHTNIFLHLNSIPTCWCITREPITFLYGSNSYIIRNGFCFLLNPMDFCGVLKRCSPAADNETQSDVDALLRPVSVPDSVRISMGNLFLLCIMFFWACCIIGELCLLIGPTWYLLCLHPATGFKRLPEESSNMTSAGHLSFYS